MEVFVGMVFCQKAEEETPKAAGKTCRHGFQLRLGEAVYSNWTGPQLPAMVLCDALLPCKGHGTSPHCLLSMVGQNIACEGSLETIPVLPGLLLARSPWSNGIGRRADWSPAGPLLPFHIILNCSMSPNSQPRLYCYGRATSCSSYQDMAFKGLDWKDGYGHGDMVGEGEEGGSFFRTPITGAAGSHVPKQDIRRIIPFPLVS